MTQATTEQQQLIRWQLEPDGIVVLVLDDPTASANTMNRQFLAALTATLDRLESERETIRGVVLTSAKKTFFAGGNLADLLATTPSDGPRWAAYCNDLKRQLRRLETLGRPVVAAINGAALGGGLELALATHHRVACAHAVVVGLPEVGLGLLPAVGGITRTVRMLGVRRAVDEVLLSGARLRPQQALDLGLVDEIVSTAADLLPAARAWIDRGVDPVQPWDVPGHRIPGGTPADPELAEHLPVLTAALHSRSKGAPAPAQRAILAAAVEGAQVDFDSAALIETRYFIPLVTGQIAKNMIQSTFFDMQTVTGGAARPAGIPAFAATKVGILGAGMMGSALAYVCAKAGLEVVLKDVTPENAGRGKDYAAKLEAKAVARGTTTEQRSARLLDLIHPTADPGDLAGADFVIEAVFEDVELKQRVFREIQDVVAPGAVLGSNTSTLPIGILAEGVRRQQDFIGIHFFSPVDKMPLVEIITGKNTASETLAKVFDFTRQIGKVPIVVNDSRGFFTSRVIMTFLDEAVAAVGEGVDPAIVEQAGTQAGYPAPPLQLLDELTLTLPRKIREEKKAAITAAGGTWRPHPAEAVIDRMIDEFDRRGRSTGGGFHAYDESGRRTGLWTGLRAAFGSGSADVPFRDLQERMLFAEALETVRCLDEGVLTSVADANIGSLLGIGFPAWTGGVLQYIDGYDGGPAGFVARARALAQRYGGRFTPPDSLVAKASRDEAYSARDRR
ncbi:3-hydroxyacyl-CoA dehydrogenase NAD-binding domain-containing protein [Nocardia sp. alder85J]|uniref:3-hydroxyacyl-CoA dehydrogenase NAD-binding domain-containing protein n=1 Tax=Nocardia sp. alder85J TaxID=2862949 RepID=UPI001CD5A550|nr:3-hydroxyacyl-CoA dehydrogenase NAD-binding domain-containing protein [Nocardia sp. alder85J]MCX4094460.1 3-hydroxyacyl-CoA dehydrogenase NAD-binding domain-containing protein [Nocardia sp. alder85J]